MTRAVIGVVVGYVVWTALWLAGGAVIAAVFPEASPEGGPYAGVVPLTTTLGLSVSCSLAGGAVAALIARDRWRGAVVALGIALLLTGIGVQAAAWSAMPIWFHLAFLVMLLPMTVVGGALLKMRTGAPQR